MPTATRTIADGSMITLQQPMQMDPELLRHIMLHRSGEKKTATASTAEDEVAVIAKIADWKIWCGLTEVRSSVFIGTTEDGDSIVTARIPIKRIEFIRSLPIVKSLKAARKLMPALSSTAIDIKAGDALPTDMNNKGGKGVIVGIVDFGCDFAHMNFLNGTKSRILKIWNQKSLQKNPITAYGALYDQNEINNALTQSDPYSFLGYTPVKASHGTHVMDIAAGNGNGTKVPGIAPESDIIFVELDSSDIPWEGTEVVKYNFGDSTHLLEALKFIFEEAKDRPCVINVSLGTNGGPHDGTTLVEQGIDSLLRQKPGRAVVIAAANAFADNIHSSETLEPQNSCDLGWELTGNPRIENEMEIWYEENGKVSIELLDPSGKSFGEIEPEEAGLERDSNGTPYIFISNRVNDPNNHKNVIGLYIKGNVGIWTVRLKNIGSNPVSYHAWIERNDDGQSRFNPASDNDYTLGSISCGRETIVVGSYDAHRRNAPLSWFSGSGPTRDNRQKPELSAPGHDVSAASALSGNGVVSKSGTSMAAPAVTGGIAVFLGEAAALGKTVGIGEIRKALINSCRKNPPTEPWHTRYGFGRFSLLDFVAQLATIPTPRPKKAAASKPKTKPPKSATPKTRKKGKTTAKKSKKAK